MRYVQVSRDLNEISGLGVTILSGLATFLEPATFRLKRTPEGMIRVTTNTGFSLTDQWLGGQARCIEALTLDHQWLDVTANCQSGSVPASSSPGMVRPQPADPGGLSDQRMNHPLELTTMMYHYVRDPGDAVEAGSGIPGMSVKVFEKSAG